MFSFPLVLSDLGLWLAVVAIILLAATEVLIPMAGLSAKVTINRGLLRVIAVGCGLAFIVTVVLHVLGMM